MENQEMMELDEHPTDAEINQALRYLDPDLCAETVEEETGAVLAFGITLLTALTDALNYISIYVRDL